MIKLVLFDMDGTLLDTEMFSIISKVEEGKKFGYQVKPKHCKNTFGMSSENSKKYLQSIYGTEFPYEYMCSKRFDYIFEDVKKNGIKLKKGANEIIAFCKENSIKIAVCTSSNSRYIKEYNKYTDLFTKFDLILTGDLITHGKPDPEIFLKAIDFFQEEPSNTLVIEDSNNGAIAGLNALCQVIFIKDLVSPSKEVKKSRVKILNSLLDVIKYIKRENSKENNHGNN